MELNCHFLYSTENDRKANVDVLEANKAANKDEIKKLREDNKEFRQKFALLQRVYIFFASTLAAISNYSFVFC